IKIQQEIKHDYDRFQFHFVIQKIQQFCSLDMGSFYLDILKDRLYTTPKNSRARLSAQNALYHILEALVRWLAPILSFTAEEIWQHIPWRKEESVFFTTWYKQFPLEADEAARTTAQGKSPAGESKAEFNDAFWQKIKEVRDAVNRELEKARNAGVIGS